VSWSERARRGAPRLLLAHALAYPMAFAWAIAAIPLAIVSVPDALIGDASVENVVQIVLRKLAWPALGVFVVEHLLAVPWARAREPMTLAADDPDRSRVTRARRAFWLTTGALFAIAIVGGGASWLWLVYR
jgi:hypothetical protein